MARQTQLLLLRDSLTLEQECGGNFTEPTRYVTGTDKAGWTPAPTKPWHIPKPGKVCGAPLFPPGGIDWPGFMEGLCWAESNPDKPCDDNSEGNDGDRGRFQFTPEGVGALHKFFCKTCKTDRCKTICARINAICPGAGSTPPDNSCVLGNAAVSKELLEFWTTGQWQDWLQRGKNETEAEFIYRILGIFHCGTPTSAKGGCAAYDGSFPITRPHDNYFIKFWCEYKKSRGAVADPPGWDQSWCAPWPQGLGR